MIANTRRNHIFTSIGRMQANYVLNAFVHAYFAFFDSVGLVEGDLTGRMVSFPNGKELQVHRNERIYTFSFFGIDYWTDERIQEVINTIVISEIDPEEEN